MSSLLLRENVLALIMAQVLGDAKCCMLTPNDACLQVYALLDQLAASVGLSMPEYQWVYALAIVLARPMLAAARAYAEAIRRWVQVFVNSLCYVILLHILYALLLGRLAGVPPGFGAAPAVIDRALAAASHSRA